jgi:hypothetical protein
MIGMALAKSIYAVPTRSRTCRLVCEHTALAAAVALSGAVPSVYACYRFTAKLRIYGRMLYACLDRVTAALHAQHSRMGPIWPSTAPTCPPTRTGQRFVSNGGRERADSEFSDQDAFWGHRSAVSTRKGGGSYGSTSWTWPSAPTPAFRSRGTPAAPAITSSIHALPLIDLARVRGFAVLTRGMDKGCDLTTVYDGCEDRNVRPIIRFAGRPPSSAAITSRRRAST